MFLYYCFAASAAAAAAATPQHTTSPSTGDIARSPHGLNNTQAQDNFHKIVSPWAITTLLGSGKFGEVRIAEHSETKEIAAAKIVQRTKLKTQKDVDHINREILFMKMLRHPHIVQLKEALKTSNNIYLFMERINGTNLVDKLQKAPKPSANATPRLDEKTARRYFQQLVLAVRYCHLKGIAHRDLKLDNVMIDTTTDSVKLIDFGLAQINPTEGVMHTLVGSPHYVSPEILKQPPEGTPSSTASATSQPTTEGYDGFASDCWSLGVILFAILSGRCPFEHDVRRELFTLITTGTYRMSRSITPDAQPLIAGLLVVDPKQRYTINNILANPWFKIAFNPILPLIDDEQVARDNIALEKKEAWTKLLQQYIETHTTAKKNIEAEEENAWDTLIQQHTDMTAKELVKSVLRDINTSTAASAAAAGAG